MDLNGMNLSSINKELINPGSYDFINSYGKTIENPWDGGPLATPLKHQKTGHAGIGLQPPQTATWMIIPFSKWLLTMVSRSPK